MVLVNTTNRTSSRVFRSIRRAVLAFIVVMLLTPAVYILVTWLSGGAEIFGDPRGGLVLGTFQFQLTPGYGLFPNLALAAVTIGLGIPKLPAGRRILVTAAAAVVGAILAWVIAAVSAEPTVVQLVSLSVPIALGWTLFSLPERRRSVAWGRG